MTVITMSIELAGKRAPRAVANSADAADEAKRYIEQTPG